MGSWRTGLELIFAVVASVEVAVDAAFAVSGEYNCGIERPAVEPFVVAAAEPFVAVAVAAVVAAVPEMQVEEDIVALVLIDEVVAVVALVIAFFVGLMIYVVAAVVLHYV